MIDDFNTVVLLRELRTENKAQSTRILELSTMLARAVENITFDRMALRSEIFQCLRTKEVA